MAKKGSPKMRRHASLALELARKCKIVQVEQGANESHDDVIVRVAQQWKCPVATNDRALRKKLRAERLPVIFLRGKKQLWMEGALET